MNEDSTPKRNIYSIKSDHNIDRSKEIPNTRIAENQARNLNIGANNALFLSIECLFDGFINKLVKRGNNNNQNLHK